MKTKKRVFQTITGRSLDLTELDDGERGFLAAVRKEYDRRPEWSRFASWWLEEFQRRQLSPDSVAVRICHDLEARLGISEGKVALPDYRDYLADLIEERYGSRYRFCKETGVDPGHLSRVLSSRSDMSIQKLATLLRACGAVLVIESEETLADLVDTQHASAALASVVR